MRTVFTALHSCGKQSSEFILQNRMKREDFRLMEVFRNEEKIPAQALHAAAVAQELFGGELSGVFLYGSATLGTLHPESDLDLLILIRSKLMPELRKSLTDHLLRLSGRVGEPGKRPLEVTVVNQNTLLPWSFPPECEYQYGEWLRADIESGKLPRNHRMPDLAILLWQARSHSISLIPGVKAADWIPLIPFGEIRKAIRLSLPDLLSWLKGDERNVLLTLCRMWFTLETGTISSKDTAAEWVLPRLPAEFVPLIRMARSAYLGECRDDWHSSGNVILLLADFMRRRIEETLKMQSPAS